MCVLQTLLKWLTCYTLQTILSRDSFLNIVVASSGWFGWIANPRKNDFSQTPNFELCVFQTLLKWLTCYSLQTILSRDSFLYIHVASSGWIGWIGNPRKNNFSQTPNFKLCVLQTLLKWLTCYSLLTILSRDSFLYIHVASSGWIGWIGNSRKNYFSQTPNFELCVLQTLLKWLTCYSLLTIL